MLLPRSYSHFSLLKAVPKVQALVDDAKQKGYTTIALTDLDTTSQIVEFVDACYSAEIKYAPGTTLAIQPLVLDQIELDNNRIALLAKNEAGYKDLLWYTTIARTERETPSYHILLQDCKDRIKDTNNVFVCLCGDSHELYQAVLNNDIKSAEKILTQYITVFGAESLLIEAIFASANVSEIEAKKHNLELLEICKSHHVKMVVSPAPRYLDPTQEEAYRVIQAITAQTRLTNIELPRPLYLYTPKELKEMFAYLPEEVFDTQAIEDQIDVTIRKDYDKHADEAFFPNYELPDGQDYAGRLMWETYINLLQKFDPIEKTRAEWMEVYSYEKVEELKQYASTIIPDPVALLGYDKDYWHKPDMIKQYIDRIEYELGIINQKGYPSYFLVFADIMQFCRDNNIVASTRGSAAGSLVGFLLNINILDPLNYQLPFERFLNPMRPSAPDIDGDFADDRREEVIQYITRKYGEANVTQIITFGTMLPRAVVRDVGRVLGVSYSKCDKLAKIIPTAPQGKKTTFKWAFETSEELKTAYDNDAEVQRIIEIAKVIEGNYRHSSSHAAGVVITPRPAVEFSGIQWDSDHKVKISQYDMRIGEKVGLIKLDILGIRNLATLGNALELVEERHDRKIDLLNLDVNDKKTFSVLARGRTMGLFQLAGPAMTRYLVDMEPNKVTDLMAMVALYRPGPMANIPDYIKRKKNPKLIKYYVPQMKEWMESSYGVLVYQDDLLYTVINLAGYDWAMADTFRKGVGKKIPEVLDSQHSIFVDGAIKHSGITREKAEEIWDIMVPFAAYGFNKAHATNYGMVAYWTAYMKANYPAEFMTALMTAEASKLDTIGAAIKECREMSLDVLPPDVNKSYQGFYIEDDKTIRYGLESVKNLGTDVIQYMINERKLGGEFASLQNLVERMAPCKGFNKRSIEALIWSGALDTLGQLAVA
jgi:DNA polymerase III subunit alpha